jgi:phage anti-repressor protein
MNIELTNHTTISSLEMVEFINSHKKFGLEITHDHFVDKAFEVLGEVEALTFRSTYKSSIGNKYPCYRFHKDEACLMAMSYGLDLQEQLFYRMTHTVNAKDLYDFLGYANKVNYVDNKGYAKTEVGNEFNCWIKELIEKYSFTQGLDFFIDYSLCDGDDSDDLPTTIEYHITIDMAQELSRIECTQAGITARNYFVDFKSKLHTIDNAKALIPAMIDLAKSKGWTDRKAGYYANTAIDLIMLTGYPKASFSNAHNLLGTEVSYGNSKVNKVNSNIQVVDTVKYFIGNLIDSYSENNELVIHGYRQDKMYDEYVRQCELAIHRRKNYKLLGMNKPTDIFPKPIGKRSFNDTLTLTLGIEKQGRGRLNTWYVIGGLDALKAKFESAYGQ